MLAASHQGMMACRNHNPSGLNGFDQVSQCLSDHANISAACRLLIANDEFVQPPLRVEPDQSKTSNFKCNRAGTSVARQHSNVATACKRRDHSLLGSHS